MISPLSSRFPQALDDDDDDVAWALQTAQVQWKRGGQADAIVWLRRAADSADQLGLVWRAADLRRSVDELTAELANAAPSNSRPPASVGGSDIDELLGGGDDDGLETIDVAAGQVALDRVALDSAGPLPSYAPVGDSEFEEEVVAIDDDEVESEVEPEPAEQEEEADVIDEDAIEDELDDPADFTPQVDPTAPISRAPISSEPNTDRDVLGLDDYVDDPVTQPHLEDPRHAELPYSPPEPEPEPEPEADPHIGDVVLGEVHGLEDLPPEGQVSLVRQATIEKLNVEEEVSSFGLALVVRGAVSVMPTIADVSCAHAKKGEIVWSQGNLDDGVALRLVASEDATEVAVWDASVLNEAVRDLPWVIDDLKTLADRFQALAGVAMGPMGERLDEALRTMVTERCEVKRLLPGEELVEKGKPVGGMFIMAAGRIEIDDGDTVDSELGPGDFLFASQVLSGGAAPHSARAGKGGALVLFAGRHVAHELLLSVPPLLEIFAG
jgi:CRP-like cAMP-binding protein